MTEPDPFAWQSQPVCLASRPPRSRRWGCPCPVPARGATAVRGGGAVVLTAADGGGASTGVGGVRGARRVARAAHGEAERAPRERRVQLPISAVGDLRRRDPQIALKQLRTGWGRPGGAPWPRWCGPGCQVPMVRPVMVVCMCALAVGRYVKSWEISRDYNIG